MLSRTEMCVKCNGMMVSCHNSHSDLARTKDELSYQWLGFKRLLKKVGYEVMLNLTESCYIIIVPLRYFK